MKIIESTFNCDVPFLWGSVKWLSSSLLYRFTVYHNRNNRYQFPWNGQWGNSCLLLRPGVVTKYPIESPIKCMEIILIISNFMFSQVKLPLNQSGLFVGIRPTKWYHNLWFIKVIINYHLGSVVVFVYF